MDETPLQTPIADTPPVNDIMENKDIAALSYAWILSVFVYFWKKESPFVRFHAKQGIVLFILSILVWLIPFVGRFLELLILALMVLGFLGAAQGQWKELPIIGDMASGRWSHVRQSWKDVVQSIVRLWRRLASSLKKSHIVPVTPVDVPAEQTSTSSVPPTPPSTPSV
jgi:fumarate reductase subunit D